MANFKDKRLFSMKKFEMQKNDVFNKFYFYSNFFLIASYKILKNDVILINDRSFFQEKDEEDKQL